MSEQKPDAMKRVLVVDDDPIVGKSFDRVLSAKGYAVITAASGEEAMKKLAEGTYDAVFTDIKMPGMSGIEVAQSLKRTRPWLPVVIVTGYGTEKAEKEAGEAGVKQFLHKPLSPDMITSAAELATAPAAAEGGSPETATESVQQANLDKKVITKAVDVSLFFASPYIALVYVLTLPFIGLGVVAWVAGDAFENKWELMGRVDLTPLKCVGLCIAAPFIGLSYIVILPIAGLTYLGWHIWKGLTRLFK